MREERIWVKKPRYNEVRVITRRVITRSDCICKYANYGWEILSVVTVTAAQFLFSKLVRFLLPTRLYIMSRWVPCPTYPSGNTYNIPLNPREYMVYTPLRSGRIYHILPLVPCICIYIPDRVVFYSIYTLVYSPPPGENPIYPGYISCHQPAILVL